MASFPGNEQLRLQYMGKLGPNEFLLRLAKDSGADTPAEFSSELGLTTREGEVLSWLSKGKTNRDIAQILGLSPRTVDKHLEQIYAKLGVENRTAAAAIATNATRRNVTRRPGQAKREPGLHNHQSPFCRMASDNVRPVLGPVLRRERRPHHPYTNAASSRSIAGNSSFSAQ